MFYPMKNNLKHVSMFCGIPVATSLFVSMSIIFVISLSGDQNISDTSEVIFLTLGMSFIPGIVALVIWQIVIRKAKSARAGLWAGLLTVFFPIRL